MLKNINISYREIEDFSKLSGIEKKLLSEAVKVIEGSYSPYSKFKVGASVLQGDVIASGATKKILLIPAVFVQNELLFLAHLQIIQIF